MKEIGWKISKIETYYVWWSTLIVLWDLHVCFYNKPNRKYHNTNLIKYRSGVWLNISQEDTFAVQNLLPQILTPHLLDYVFCRRSYCHLNGPCRYLEVAKPSIEIALTVQMPLEWVENVISYTIDLSQLCMNGFTSKFDQR